MKTAFSKAEFESVLTSRFGITLKPREKTAAEVVSTGIAEVDSLTGGFPRGAITEIFGLASSGRTTVVLSSLAEATQREEVCALVDTSDTFHPQSAASAGVLLDQLLWMRCGSKLEQAFKATDLLLQGGGFGLVLLDIGDVPARDARRIISSWWYRFRRVIESTPTAFVVVAADSCVRSCATLTLEMKRAGEVWFTTSNSETQIPTLPVPQGKFPAAVKSIQPSRNSSLPTHSTLLTNMRLEIERLKPVHSGARATSFEAQTLT